MIDSKRIAKNTGFLYVRMLIIMFVSLYTSRVVLDVLGVDDYGLYNLVGGIVGMLTFLNGTLSTATSRFLTFDIGIGDFKRLKQTFNTTLIAHLVLGVLVILIMETVGLWYVYNKAIIPVERLDPTLYVFHISVATVLVTFTQVPYTSLIMAHEQMKAFAYISLLEAILKLTIAYLITISPIDKLVFYAILMFVSQMSVAMIYRSYCYKHWKESHISWEINFSTLKNLLSFSGWNIIAHIAETFRVQGLIMLFGMFFQPMVIAAQSIATQLSNGITQFTNNFRSAINPQIIKLYATKDYEESKKLTIESSIYIYELYLLFGIPIFLLIEPIMHLWLKEVPEYAVAFSRCIIASAMFGVFSGGFYTPLTAAGKLKGNSIAALCICGGQFVIAYILLKTGQDVMFVQYSYILVAMIFGLIVKPYLLIREVNYNITDFTNCFKKTFTIFVSSFILPFILFLMVDVNTIAGFILVGATSVLSVITVSYLFLPKKIKIMIPSLIKKKFGIGQ
ncbi:polysaccharide biosynthesis protein [Bacteroides sp. ET336]|uniref:polysaccharide biosynthesis protein n=1 Tax=Bacteroides sp. ET336 TaxID=2972459 RepID=UPI0021AC3813|nr:polysaccharide biosynthesis protein [Bacteroides sp. ET336]MCR8894219.1 polysaccharide biosynthesis protein [Bacteroides sp. ET336]MDN0058716.1 polysaccharide biosynthesis protein [Bacteroides caecigallinarum]